MWIMDTTESLWFKNHFNVFQHINIDTRQICFVTPVWATLQWKSRKIDLKFYNTSQSQYQYGNYSDRIDTCKHNINRKLL